MHFTGALLELGVSDIAILFYINPSDTCPDHMQSGVLRHSFRGDSFLHQLKTCHNATQMDTAYISYMLSRIPVESLFSCADLTSPFPLNLFLRIVFFPFLVIKHLCCICNIITSEAPLPLCADEEELSTGEGTKWSMEVSGIVGSWQAWSAV